MMLGNALIPARFIAITKGLAATPGLPLSIAFNSNGSSEETHNVTMNIAKQ
jgi:hypothetical protein